MTGKIIRPAPAEIEFRNMRFLITDQPQDGTMDNYIKLLQEHKVSHLVCATDQLYKTEELTKSGKIVMIIIFIILQYLIISGVTVSELSFTDGSAPTLEIVEKWLCLVNKEFLSDPDTCIGVHCVTGLGRAPVLVATALIELGMKYEVLSDICTGCTRNNNIIRQLYSVNVKQNSFTKLFIWDYGT